MTRLKVWIWFFKICAIRKWGQVVTLYLTVLGYNDVKNNFYVNMLMTRGKKIKEKKSTKD